MYYLGLSSAQALYPHINKFRYYRLFVGKNWISMYRYKNIFSFTMNSYTIIMIFIITRLKIDIYMLTHPSSNRPLFGIIKFN